MADEILGVKVPAISPAELHRKLLENYQASVMTGARRPDDPNGPIEHHIVIVDNGRSAMLAGKFRDMLRCIRCGA
ncbi:MAG: hypothetical protein ACXW3R_02955, partial [Rhodoplanes sp.]